MIPREALIVLRQAADEMSNNGCNDFYLSDTPEHRKFITEMMTNRSNDVFDIEECIYKGKIIATDWMILEYIAELLEQQQ